MRCLAAYLLLLLAVCALFPPSTEAEKSLGYPFCDGLRDPDSKGACLDYVNAANSIGKWTSAVRWARFYKSSCELLCVLLLLLSRVCPRNGNIIRSSRQAADTQTRSHSP